MRSLGGWFGHHASVTFWCLRACVLMHICMYTAWCILLKFKWHFAALNEDMDISNPTEF